MSAFRWFKVHSNLPRHPKAVALGVALENPLAWAHVVALWAYACEFAPSGALPSRDGLATVERAALWTGARGAFYSAAIEAGWIDEADGEIVLHDWAEVQEAHLKKAERDRKNAKKRRKTNASAVADSSRDGRATDALRNGGASREEREREREREKEQDQVPVDAQVRAPTSGATAGPPGEDPPHPADEPPVVASKGSKKPKAPPDAQFVPDRERYIARFRELFASPNADFTGGQAINFARLRKKHGMPILLAALDGLAARPFNRANRTLGFAASQDGIDLGTREPDLPLRVNDAHAPFDPNYRPKEFE